MKFQFSKLVFRVMPAAICLLMAVSCKKVFDVQPEVALDREQTYRNVFDANAAVWGVYGKLLNVAQRYMLLNELRADLMDYTGNADDYIKQLSNHTVTPENPYINPQPFYDVILNCNDVLKNFNIMYNDKKLMVDEYNQRYSDITAVRTWLYLQLGIHYGSVPYVTDPLENAEDIHDQAKFPLTGFDQLLDNLVHDMQSLPTLEDYTTSATGLRTTVDQYNTQKFFINKYFLLGDLYLWRGKGDDYNQAARQYKRVMSTGSIFRTNDIVFFEQYKIWQHDVVNNNDIGVGYIRYREADQNALIDNNTQGWRSIFARPFGDAMFNNEVIWALPFDKNFAPQNPFIDMFSPVGGRYLVKPSQAAIDFWNSQRQVNNFPFDARGRFTWRTILGQPVIMKYLYNYIDPFTGVPLVNLQERTSKWFLYRAATLHLRYAEATNRDAAMNADPNKRLTRHKIAYGIVNNGIKAAFDNPATVDNTNEMQTFDEYPYDFDARQGDPPGPVFRSEWYRGVGIRGRANVRAIAIDSARYFDMITPPNPNRILKDPVGFTNFIEDMIINEAALETAYEGHRWQDLLRVARRRMDGNFLVEKIKSKHTKSANPNPGTADQLKNQSSWYLPFKW